MGYHMAMTISNFKIKNENRDKALELLKALARKDEILDWVNHDVLSNAGTLAEALIECRYEIKEDRNGNVIAIDFSGEKIGCDFDIFSALAPTVEDNSFIEMSGECGDSWRWFFKNGECKEMSPEPAWRSRQRRTIIQFNFDTGDHECPWYQVFVIAESDADIDFDSIEDSISSYMDSSASEDMEFEDNVTDIMNASGLLWSFISGSIPASKAVHTFWI